MIKCKRCGKKTGPVFGLCSDCIIIDDSITLMEELIKTCKVKTGRRMLRRAIVRLDTVRGE